MLNSCVVNWHAIKIFQMQHLNIKESQPWCTIKHFSTPPSSMGIFITEVHDSLLVKYCEAIKISWSHRFPQGPIY